MPPLAHGDEEQTSDWISVIAIPGGNERAEISGAEFHNIIMIVVLSEFELGEVNFAQISPDILREPVYSRGNGLSSDAAALVTAFPL